ncbi:MAG: hypothetical protein ACE5OP_08260 [Candidatus Glassbacteria bacterium]
MKLHAIAFPAVVLLALSVAVTAAIAQEEKGDWVLPESVTLKVGHRLYPDFSEEHTVKIGERFPISDEGYEAMVVKYLPDFAIQIKDGEKKIFSKTSEPNNPALWIIVYKDSAAVDSVWAFGGKGSPHFTRSSFIYFQILGMKQAEPEGAAQETQK